MSAPLGCTAIYSLLLSPCTGAASRTLTDPLAWRGSTLLAESVTSLKQRHDELHVIGSLNLVQSLLRFGLLDRLNLWLYPLLLGSGKKGFDDGTRPPRCD